jgi:peptidoglycan-N-acetylglucosamine deacetylase
MHTNANKMPDVMFSWHSSDRRCSMPTEFAPGPSGHPRRRRAGPHWFVALALVIALAGCFPKPPSEASAKVYLTFDDGPSVYTPQILSTLDAKGARATFFVVGEHATQYPSYVQQENANGHVIGDHTWDHPDLTTLPPDQIRWELESAADEIENLTGKRPTLWRAPYSHSNATVNEIASSLGLSGVGADVNSRDYLLPGTDAIVSAVVDNVHDGSIVLLHDGSPDGSGDRSQTVEALPTIIDTLRARGYEIATL